MMKGDTFASSSRGGQCDEGDTFASSKRRSEGKLLPLLTQGQTCSLHIT